MVAIRTIVLNFFNHNIAEKVCLKLHIKVIKYGDLWIQKYNQAHYTGNDILMYDIAVM